MIKAITDKNTQSFFKILLYFITIIGFVIGAWHLRYALTAIFLFKEDEPWTSWAYMFSGPLSTFPVIIISLFKRKLAGIWLALGSILSTSIFIVSEKGANEYLLSVAGKVTLPMLILGIIMFAFAVWKEKLSGT